VLSPGARMCWARKRTLITWWRTESFRALTLSPCAKTWTDSLPEVTLLSCVSQDSRAQSSWGCCEPPPSCLSWGKRGADQDKWHSLTLRGLSGKKRKKPRLRSLGHCFQRLHPGSQQGVPCGGVGRVPTCPIQPQPSTGEHRS
jgi:hypothetical protein